MRFFSSTVPVRSFSEMTSQSQPISSAESRVCALFCALGGWLS